MYTPLLNPHQWSLAKQQLFKKMNSDALIVPKLAKAKKDGLMNPNNYNFNQF